MTVSFGTPDYMEWASILDRASVLIHFSGHVKGQCGSVGGGFDIIGAIRYAVDGNALSRKQSIEARHLSDDILVYVAEQMDGGLTKWNDRPWRTKKSVERKLLEISTGLRNAELRRRTAALREANAA